MGLEHFVERPLNVANNLALGGCGGDYVDACLLVSGLVSAIASFVWPGTRGDRRRFIEACVRFSDKDSDADKISVPLLRIWLLEQKRFDEVRALEAKRPQFFGRGYGARVVLGEEVDADEAELRAEFPMVDLAILRQHSYPTVLYEQVRCKLVHEGELDGKASRFPMTTRDEARISYVNRTVAVLDGGTVSEPQRDRRIFFHMTWLTDLVRTMARKADAELLAGPLPEPARWWVSA
jgi:hypothetical protein